MRSPVEKHRHSDGKFQPEWADAVIADLAGRQHGVLARRQLSRLRIGEDAIEYRIRRKRLHAMHQGVYAVGHSVLSRHGRWMAAVLAGRPGAALSHRDGAALHGLVQSSHRDFDVTVPVKGRRRKGIRFHYADLPPDERAVVDGIPVTSVPRTILDLASIWRRDRVELALHESEVQRLHDRLSLRDLLERHPRARGVRVIRAILAERDQTITKEDLVRLFLDLLDEYGLPRPLLNHPIWIGDRWIEADCVWPEQGLIVELDGYAVHGTRRNFESDRERDRRLAVRGWRTPRVTWRQLREDRDELAADIRALLAAGRPIRAAA